MQIGNKIVETIGKLTTAITGALVFKSMWDWWNSLKKIDEWRVYTLKEAAKVLRVSHDFLRQEIEAGRLIARPMGNDYRIAGRYMLEYLRHQQPKEDGTK
jgi:excisionase family DNA binding protein